MSEIPYRVQMTRNKPWRADHPDAVIVSRPTKWGNPYRVRKASWTIDGLLHGWVVADYADQIVTLTGIPSSPRARFDTEPHAAACAARLYAEELAPDVEDRLMVRILPTVEEIRRDLGGKDLACWCPVWDATRPCLRCHGSRSYPKFTRQVCSACQGTGFARHLCHADVLLIAANPDVVFPWAVNYSEEES